MRGDITIDGHTMIGGGDEDWFSEPWHTSHPVPHYDLAESLPKPLPPRPASAVDCPGPPIFDDKMRAKLRAAIARARDE